MLLSQLQLRILIALAAAVVVAELFVGGHTPSPSWLSYLSPVVPVLLLALTAFDRIIWRFPLFRYIPGFRPNLHGTWKVTLRPKNGAPVDAFMVVRQTYSSLSLRLMTAESTSELVAHQFITSPDGVLKVGAVYRNEPDIAVRDRSPIHYGTILLALEENPPRRVRGSYWTDRTSVGDLELTSRDKRILGTYATARDALG